jgi:hypothetical protein
MNGVESYTLLSVKRAKNLDSIHIYAWQRGGDMAAREER